MQRLEAKTGPGLEAVPGVEAEMEVDRVLVLDLPL